jgi:hypothetical protein
VLFTALALFLAKLRLLPCGVPVTWEYMDGDRVGSLIESLTSTYEAAFNFYTKWKQKQEDDNHYYRGADKRSPVVSKCGLGTSLDLSSYRIKSTYQVGFAIIGPEFFVGDSKSTCARTFDAHSHGMSQQSAATASGKTLPSFTSASASSA